MGRERIPPPKRRDCEMKKIIEGKKYDTDTSTLVAEWEADFLANDFNW